MIPRSFFFLRHGETDWNKNKVLQGFTDIPLNETGRAQAKNIIPVLEKLPIDRVVASTLSRANETARIVNAALNKPFTEDDKLWERHFGIYEGKDETVINKLKEEALANPDQSQVEENGYVCPPGAESYADFKARTFNTITKHLNAFEGENILFVAHGGLYRVLTRALLDFAGSSPNVQPFHFEKQGDIWALHTIS